MVYTKGEGMKTKQDLGNYYRDNITATKTNDWLKQNKM